MNARQITEALGGRWCGSYGTARCPVHEDRSPSLSIADGHSAVVVKCFAGCDGEAVIAELKGRGLWPEPNTSSRSHRRSSTTTSRAHSSRQHVAPKREPANGTPATAWLPIWRASEPAPGTLVEIYLKGRGITDPPPPSLRYHGTLKHGPTGLLLPAMVAGVQGPDGRLCAIHRTYLDHQGRKSTVTSAKMMLGPCSGGAVRLAKIERTLAVAEGIETALSVQQATGTPAWATLSTSGLRSLVIPATVHELVIYADGDPAGEAAAQALAERATAEGIVTSIARAPEGQDFNDIVRRPQ